jgi:hypothetical protein
MLLCTAPDTFFFRVFSPLTPLSTFSISDTPRDLHFERTRDAAKESFCCFFFFFHNPHLCVQSSPLAYKTTTTTTAAATTRHHRCRRPYHHSCSFIAGRPHRSSIGPKKPRQVSKHLPLGQRMGFVFERIQGQTVSDRCLSCNRIQG